MGWVKMGYGWLPQKRVYQVYDLNDMTSIDPPI